MSRRFTARGAALTTRGASAKVPDLELELELGVKIIEKD
jgi:hypothetical protein